MAKKVLIIDDDPDFVTTTTIAVESGGYDVVSAPDGRSGLEAVAEEAPDLIVLDVMMPGMDGWEVCETLKEDEDTCGIPIIMLTSVASHIKDTQYTREGGQATQADDYIPKPAEPAAILKAVRKLLGPEA